MSATSQVLPTILKAGAVFAMFTGALDVCFGLNAFNTTNSHAQPLPMDLPISAFTDSQVRFLASTWGAYGAMLWWVANDIPSRRTPLALLGSAMLIGGIGRTISAYQYGVEVAPRFLTGAIAVEFILPGLMYALS